ncbi:hypothetical protein [Thauera butanivorans]|uniref:hypothetical protein n=1 Tax=Thauera butanivorans TaxID=86174 RepID=UPI0008385891|nr:hypothetical protein [Thauera butanivorans]
MSKKAVTAVAEIAVPEPAPEAAAPVMTVRCTRLRGVWRAGRFWPPEVVRVFAGDLSDEQLAAVRAEPLLSVREVEHE